MAKESVVSVLEVFFGSAGGVTAAMTGLAAAVMLVFSLLYTPCVATIACIRRELSTRSAVLILSGQCAIAWVCALIVNIVVNLII